MPNIEIRGFFFRINPETLGVRVKIEDEAFEIRDKVEEIMRKIGLGEDAITDIVPSISTSLFGKVHKLMPYLRVCDTDPDRMNRIVQALKEENINMDVEMLLLSGFIEAKDMKA